MKKKEVPSGEQRDKRDENELFDIIFNTLR